MKGEGMSDRGRQRGGTQRTRVCECEFRYRWPEFVNCATIRGLMTTVDGAKIYLVMNGIAMLRQADKARVFTTSLTLRGS